jgi:RecA-family ATPase
VNAHSIIRPGTKNIIEALEKTFKTTMVLQFTIGMACGHKVSPSLLVAYPVSVLYIHREMTVKELAERRKSSLQRIPTQPLTVGKSKVIDGRCLYAHLVNPTGVAG